MTFTGFNLFSDVNQFVNTENVSAFNNVTGVKSFGTFAADQLYGTALGSGALTQFIKFGLAGYGFIVDTITKERLVFQYNVDIKESGGAEYAQQNTLARSIPQYQYKGGKERLLDMPITFTMKERHRDDVRRSVRWLQALCYPEYNGGIEASIAPHPVVVIQGKLYWKDVWIVKDFSVEWGKARDPITQLPSEATVNLTLAEISGRGKSYSEMIFL
jgi:hypothetical protein